MDNMENQEQPKEKLNFFEMIWEMITGGADPNREKRRLIKEIGKSLKKMRQKYYTPKHNKAQPGMAKLFYELYKILGPGQSLVQHADTSGVLKAMVIESFMDNSQKESLNAFDEDTIKERAKFTEPRALAEELKEAMAGFFNFFDSDRVKVINHTYSALQRFLNLIHFDYYFFIKKFDANLPEGNFFYKPNFEAINGEYISDDLKDFLEVAADLEKGIDWDYILNILHDYRGADIVSRNAFKKMLRRLSQILKSGVLELIIRHVDNDPYYKSQPQEVNSHIVEGYLSKLKTQTEMTIQKIVHAKRTKNIEELCMKVFGTVSISRTKNYTEKVNTLYKKKMMGGYLYVTPLNYLKAFLIDFNKKDVREIVDLLLVKGKWTTNLLSQHLSESFQSLVVVSDRLLEFDDSLSDETQLGTRLKAILMRSDKDKKAAHMLRQMLKEINEKAKKLMVDSAQGLIGLGKHIKQLLDDFSRTPHELIINWKEVDLATDNTIKTQLTEIYKKIYFFIKLLQFFK